MAFNFLCLKQGTILTTSLVTLYIAPPTVKTLLRKITLTNYTDAETSVQINLVPSGGAAGDANIVRTHISVPGTNGGECVTVNELTNHILNPGDFIQAKAANATTVNIRISGAEITGLV